MRLALALLLVAACSSNQTPPAGPGPQSSGSATAAGGEGSGSATALAGSGASARVEIADVAELEPNRGKEVDVKGTARNAKLAAAIVLPGAPIYCLGLDGWPSDVANKPVLAHGTLEHSDEFAAEGGAAGTSGAVWVLRGCTYETP